MTLAGMTVLLAEDNPTNQMVAMHMLESLGAEVTLAVDGAEALCMLDDRRFDLALIDIEMPRISGLDLIRRLRAANGPAAAMPMIALTAYVMREHRAAIEDAGADGIIAKPILSIEQFGDEISRYIRLRRGRADRASPASGTALPAMAPAAGPPGTDAREPDPPDPEPEIDRTVFDGIWTSFDAAGRRELVSRLVMDIGAACESLAAAVHEGDLRGVGRATHNLVSLAGAVGAVRLQALAERLNSAGARHDDRPLGERGVELLIEAERVLKFVHRMQQERAA